jgi:hypothetical protein
MSGVFEAVQTSPEDHHPIPHLIEDHGTWQEWSIGCICGFYDKGTPNKWYIPSEGSAMRLYHAHLKVALGLPDEPEEEDDDVLPARAPFDLTGAFV